MKVRQIFSLLLLGLPGLVRAQAVAPAANAAPVDLGGSLLQLVLALILVLALLVGSLWVLKRVTAQRGQAAGLLRVVAGTLVGARERVVIVEVGSTWLVLGVAPGRVSALAEIPRQSLPSDLQSSAGKPAALDRADFPEWLRKLIPGNAPPAP